MQSTLRPRNVAANPSNRLQDLFRLVPDSVITLNDLELENDDESLMMMMMMMMMLAALLAVLAALLAKMAGLGPD
jgi:hypothetical protein